MAHITFGESLHETVLPNCLILQFLIITEVQSKCIWVNDCDSASALIQYNSNTTSCTREVKTCATEHQNTCSLTLHTWRIKLHDTRHTLIRRT